MRRHTARAHNKSQLPPVHLNLTEQKAKPLNVLLEKRRN